MTQTIKTLNRLFLENLNSKSKFLYSALVRLHLKYLCPPLQSASIRDMKILKRVQQRLRKMTKGLKRLSNEERLKDFGLFSLEKSHGESHQFIQILEVRPTRDLLKALPT